jgi:hypothetical protein
MFNWKFFQYALSVHLSNKRNMLGAAVQMPERAGITMH